MSQWYGGVSKRSGGGEKAERRSDVTPSSLLLTLLPAYPGKNPGYGPVPILPSSPHMQSTVEGFWVWEALNPAPLLVSESRCLVKLVCVSSSPTNQNSKPQFNPSLCVQEQTPVFPVACLQMSLHYYWRLKSSLKEVFNHAPCACRGARGGYEAWQQARLMSSSCDVWRWPHSPFARATSHKLLMWRRYMPMIFEPVYWKDYHVISESRVSEDSPLSIQETSATVSPNYRALSVELE